MNLWPIIGGTWKERLTAAALFLGLLLTWVLLFILGALLEHL